MSPIWIPSYERTMENLRGLENRDAERRVAKALNEITAQDVWIFHSLRYSRSRHEGASVNLEIDFLVVWKNMGFLILEVKGGRVEYDPYENKWWCNPRNQPRKAYSRSPVAQVEGQKNDFCNDVLLRYLSKQHNARNIVERVLVFPHVNLADFKDQHGQRVKRIDDFEIESIVGRERMQTLAAFVRSKLEPCELYVYNKNVPGKLFEDVVNFLRPSVCAEVNPQHILENAESRIEAATEEQKEHLRHVIEARWLLIDGPAGSAKTVLGLSAVLSWMESGANAYFITANKYLVAGLRKDVRYSLVKDRIMTIHAFLEMSLDTKMVTSDSAMSEALSNCCGL